jgi:hypothetical protein
MWPRPLLTHDRQHDVHHAIEVCSELAFDLGCGHLFKITKQVVARIVDHDVDVAELLHRLINSRCRSCFVGNVQLEKHSILGCNVAAGTAHFVEVSSGRDDAVTGLQCRLGDSGFDAPAGACAVINQTLTLIALLLFGP